MTRANSGWCLPSLCLSRCLEAIMGMGRGAPVDESHPPGSPYPLRLLHGAEMTLCPVPVPSACRERPNLHPNYPVSSTLRCIFFFFISVYLQSDLFG